MAKGYYMMNRDVLKFEPQKDFQKIIFNHYIMRKENLNSMNSKLPKGQFYLTVRTVAKDLDMSVAATHRLIKTFEELKIIELIECGKKTKSPSIYKYNSVPEYDTKHIKNHNEGQSIRTHFGTDYGTSKIDNINTKDLNLWVSEFGR